MKESASVRFMFHSFPRRQGQDSHAKGVAILGQIIKYGFLLTPEITHWRDRRNEGRESDEYIQVSRRCCFTELAEAELSAHASHFGAFAIEFDHRTLCDLGAMPVFYIPRMSEYEDYGVGPAIVTQMAHLQELLGRLDGLEKFALVAAKTAPHSMIEAAPTVDGGLRLYVSGTDIQFVLSREIIELAKRNPTFSWPDFSKGPLAAGISGSGLLNILRIVFWGIHKIEVLHGMVKGLASTFYPTERKSDPVLQYYQQREWRLLGGLLRDGAAVTTPVSNDHRANLLALDPEFFGRTIYLPTGASTLVDECEVFLHNPGGAMVMELARRVICPASAIRNVKAVLGKSSIEIVPLEEFK